jgi:mono/diheme cytochrome c family protein
MMRQPVILWLCVLLACCVRGQEHAPAGSKEAAAPALISPTNSSVRPSELPRPATVSPPAEAPRGTNAVAPLVQGLGPDAQALFDLGKELYQFTCASCHQLHGNGQEGLAPPLRGSTWVTGSEGRLVRIVLNGLRGPLRVQDKVYAQDMPALGVLEDEQIAALLTYVRREWGHSAAPVAPSTVRQIRADTRERLEAWTAEELLKVP